MPEFCHPEFGCDCPTITDEEWAAIYDALRGIDDEYGLKVGEGRSLGSYRREHKTGSLDDYYKAAQAASERGQALLEKVAKLTPTNERSTTA